MQVQSSSVLCLLILVITMVSTRYSIQYPISTDAQNVYSSVQVYGVTAVLNSKTHVVLALLAWSRTPSSVDLRALAFAPSAFSDLASNASLVVPITAAD